MIQARILDNPQIHQGDIFKDIDCIEHADITDGHVEISKIRYPYVIVLSQECDLTQDFTERCKSEGDAKNWDKVLPNVIVAPLYNFEHFRVGEHLSNFGYTMAKDYINVAKTPAKTLKQNNNPRYQYLDFDQSIPVVASVLDFKHFFTVSIAGLYALKKTNYVCSLDTLFRERVSQRFANFLARIGLPDGR